MPNYAKYINKSRMISTFKELVNIDSPSLKEAKISKKVTSMLKQLGCKVTTDNADEKFRGEIGNVIARFPGTIKPAPILLCAHLDTIFSNKGNKPVLKGNRITGNGKTILGADCKAGLTVILETLRIIKENKIQSPPVEVVFTVCEDLKVLGSKYLDYKKINARYGIIFDDTFADLMTISTAGRYSLDITITGKPAHAALEPHKGISAIELAAKAISKLKFGNIDHETIFNIGIIEGGNATNIVTPQVRLQGEIRSHKPEKMTRLIKKVKKVFDETIRKSRRKIDGKWHSAKLKFDAQKDFSHFSISQKNHFVKLVKKCASSQGVKLRFRSVNASADCNNFFANGISAPLLGCGIHNFHSNKEYLDLNDFFKATQIALAVVVGFKIK